MISSRPRSGAARLGVGGIPAGRLALSYKIEIGKRSNAPLEPVVQIPDSIHNSWDRTWPFAWLPNLVTKCQPVPVAWPHVAKRLQKWDAP